jgi:hypothetical protein
MLDVDPISSRPSESLWRNGLSPLWGGLVFFLLGTRDLLERFLPPTPLAQHSARWAVICVAATLFVAVTIWGRRSIRARVVSPPSGYVEPKSHNWLLLPVLLVPLVLVPIVIANAFTSYGRSPAPYALDDDRLFAPGFAVMFAALSLYYGWKRKAPLLSVYAIYLICLALLIWLLPLSPNERDGLLMSGAGGPLVAFGAVRLRAFLRTKSKPPEG